MHPVNVTSLQDQSHGLYVGDKVHIKTRQGESHQFKIVKITDDALFGEGIQILFENIESIEQKEYSSEKTVALTAGSYLAYITVLTVVIFNLLLDAAFGQ